VPATWLLKAATQKLLSVFPRGERTNYMLRRYVSRTLPLDDDTFFRMADIAGNHLKHFISCGHPRDLSASRFYEIGAGWDLVSPLLYRCAGIRSQTLIDIKPNIVPALVQNSMGRLLQARARIEEALGIPLDAGPLRHVVRSAGDLEKYLGITYRAPCDAARTGLPAASFDFISSTSTLEHVPEEDLPALLRECFRLLRPDGIMSLLIDLKDHYSYCDRGVSIYNFLRFSDKTWRLFNSSLHFQNRLRYPDYLRAVDQAGFDCRVCRPELPDDRDRQALASLKLDGRFAGHFDDTGVKTLWLVVRKKT